MQKYDDIVCMYMPKVGIKFLLISYLSPESFVLASARILFLVPYFLMNPFDPYSPLISHHSSNYYIMYYDIVA